MKLVFCFSVIFQIFWSIQAYKILGVFTYCAHSHSSLGHRLMKELADRGHNVTLITCIPKRKPTQNFREISVEEHAIKLSETVEQLEEFGKLSFLGQLEFIREVGIIYTSEVLKNKDVQDLMNSNEEFDLIIQEQFMNEAMAIFQHRFKCPLILFAPGPTTIFNNYLVGNPSPPSFVPNLLTDYGSKMSFWQRLENTYQSVVGELFVHLKIIPEQNKLLKEIFPNAPELSSILYNVSLLLLTSHFSMSDPVPLQQNVKVIGGFHVSPPQPLSSDLQEFLDEAKEGVILFSMGSNLKSANFEPSIRKAILNSFSKIKQKVLWKFETDLPEKPDNVKILKWLPQQDVMAHPNVVAFISHGGLLGTIEAVYYGVPILGLPVFWDQKKNIEDAVRKGFGIRLEYENINEELFTEALNEILNNPRYGKTAKDRSKIMHDQPLKQIDEAVFWIEYVVRHGGADHLKSIAVTLPWYQKYLVDILLFISIIVFVIVFVTVYALKRLFLKEKKNKIKTN